MCNLSRCTQPASERAKAGLSLARSKGHAPNHCTASFQPSLSPALVAQGSQRHPETSEQEADTIQAAPAIIHL